jgi:hypothetical protein
LVSLLKNSFHYQNLLDRFLSSTSFVISVAFRYIRFSRQIRLPEQDLVSPTPVLTPFFYFMRRPLPAQRINSEFVAKCPDSASIKWVLPDLGIPEKLFCCPKSSKKRRKHIKKPVSLPIIAINTAAYSCLVTINLILEIQRDSGKSRFSSSSSLKYIHAFFLNLGN